MYCICICINDLEDIMDDGDGETCHSMNTKSISQA